MKANPKPWLYGPNWQGQRCEARTRRGTPCKRSARLPVGRCKLHGGSSTGPRTKDGLARLTEARTKHGLYTKEKRAEARRFAEEGRQMRGELKELETLFVTTVIWTRTGGTNSNRGLVIVGHWHWTDCLGGYCGLSWGQAGMPLRGTH